MIELKNISKTYGKSTVKAVDSLSLTIPNGVIFGFLGPNGAGKTTTIKALSGALRLDEGSVAIDGISMADAPLEAKQHIGLVNDNPELFNRLKAHEFLNFIGDVFSVPSDIRKERIDDLARRFSLSDVLTTSIGSMSRGMKQKLSIIASLIHDPENWILRTHGRSRPAGFLRTQGNHAGKNQSGQVRVFFDPCHGSCGKGLRPARYHQ